VKLARKFSRPYLAVVCISLLVLSSSQLSCSTCGPHPGKNPNIYDYLYWRDCIDLRQAKTPESKPGIVYFKADDRCLSDSAEYQHIKDSAPHRNCNVEEMPNAEEPQTLSPAENATGNGSKQIQ
jgi:hypothetical protein